VIPWGFYGSIDTTEPGFFGCENKALTHQDHFNLDAWGFGMMLYNLFIGQTPWSNEMCNYFKRVQTFKEKHPDKAPKTATKLKIIQATIQAMLQTHIEIPLRQLQKNPQPSQEEKMKVLIFKLLRQWQQYRITLTAAYDELSAIINPPQHITKYLNITMNNKIEC
ncbi:MAG TPA: hypothetical protein VN457_06980, partial [Chlamydiales bacterium]|nr:hypothetical protein [Chlamydiales bacterium]